MTAGGFGWYIPSDPPYLLIYAAQGFCLAQYM